MQTFNSISYFEICPPAPFQPCLSGILASEVKVLPTPCSSGFFFETDFSDGHRDPEGCVGPSLAAASGLEGKAQA